MLSSYQKNEISNLPLKRISDDIELITSKKYNNTNNPVNISKLYQIKI